MKSECLNLCDFIGCEGGFAQGGGSLIHYSAKGHWTPTLSIIKQICGERGTTGSSTPKQPHSGTGGTCLSGSPHLRCPEPNGPQAHPPARTCRRAALHARSACVCVWSTEPQFWHMLACVPQPARYMHARSRVRSRALCVCPNPHAACACPLICMLRVCHDPHTACKHRSVRYGACPDPNPIRAPCVCAPIRALRACPDPRAVCTPRSVPDPRAACKPRSVPDPLAACVPRSARCVACPDPCALCACPDPRVVCVPRAPTCALRTSWFSIPLRTFLRTHPADSRSSNGPLPAWLQTKGAHLRAAGSWREYIVQNSSFYYIYPPRCSGAALQLPQ